MQNIAILDCWTTRGYDENKIKSEYESSRSSSRYSLDILKKVKLSNLFINEDSAVEVAVVIPNAKHAIEEDIEQDQLMEIVELLLKRLEDN